MTRQRVEPEWAEALGRVHRYQTERAVPDSGRRDGVASVQRSVGNQTVQRLADSGQAPEGLTVSQPGDPAEREAERVAEQVTGTDSAGTSTRPRPTQTGGERLQRLCDRCR